MAPSPVAIVCIGMAGSGKTTFMQRINSYLHSLREPPYVMNLDPAVRTVPFDSNIDIRDSINYKEVMSQYNLGPNGGILTSLNLFATKVDQVLNILEKRCGSPYTPSTTTNASNAVTGNIANPTPTTGTSPATSEGMPKAIKHILVDTPGQIEVFVWSVSGQILLSSLASSFPTVLAYIIDTPRTASTSTFMSNMLYAISILYKMKLPMILVFNKTDVQSADFAKEWMTDFEAFQTALQKEEATGSFGGAEGVTGPAVGGSGYMSSLLNSMSLVLEEFYKHLNVVGVSALTGAGMKEFFEAVEAKAEEFDRDYRPELERRWNQREKDKLDNREKELGRLMRDLNVEAVGGSGKQRRPMRRNRKEEPETISDLEDENEDDQDEPEAEMVEPDDDMAEDDDEEEDERNPRRRVPTDAGPGKDSSKDDMSFARYIRSGNINR